MPTAATSTVRRSRPASEAGITTYVPKPMTSNAKAEGRFSKADFIYIAKDDEYQCPAGERAIYRFSTYEKSGLKMRTLLEQRLPALRHEGAVHDRATIDASAAGSTKRCSSEMQRRLDRKPDAMTLRRRTIEHVFGTLKHWMGSTHFLDEDAQHVGTEMSLHVLAYNLKRVIKRAGHCQNDEGDATGRGMRPLYVFSRVHEDVTRPRNADSEHQNTG